MHAFIAALENGTKLALQWPALQLEENEGIYNRRSRNTALTTIKIAREKTNEHVEITALWGAARRNLLRVQLNGILWTDLN